MANLDPLGINEEQNLDPLNLFDPLGIEKEQQGRPTPVFNDDKTNSPRSILAGIGNSILGQSVSTGIASGIASGSLDKATESIESSKHFFSNLLQLDRDYVAPEAHIVRGLMTAGFGVFADIGKTTGQFYADLTGSPAIGATLETTISLLPLAFGAKPKEYKPTATPKIIEGLRAELIAEEKLGDFIKNNLYETKSQLTDAFKEAVISGDEKKQVYLQD